MYNYNTWYIHHTTKIRNSWNVMKPRNNCNLHSKIKYTHEILASLKSAHCPSLFDLETI